MFEVTLQVMGTQAEVRAGLEAMAKQVVITQARVGSEPIDVDNLPGSMPVAPLPTWDYDMAPDTYLTRYPTGPRAEEARAYILARSGA